MLQASRRLNPAHLHCKTSEKRVSLVLNSSLDAVGRRAVMGVGAVDVSERLVVKKPTGINHASKQNSGRQLRQLASHSIQIHQNASTTGTAAITDISTSSSSSSDSLSSSINQSINQ